MDILNNFVASVIGLLVIALGGSGGSIEVGATAGADTTTTAATTSIVVTDRSFLEGLRDSLVSLQVRLQNSSKERSSGDHEADNDMDDEGSGSDSNKGSNSGSNHDGEEDDSRSASNATSSTSVNVSAKHSEDNDDDRDEDTGDEDDDSQKGSGSSSNSGSGGSTSNSGSGSANTSASTALTMAEVAQHANAASCYSVIDGSVYDLTTWIPQHPGGSAAILLLCGKDGTSAFNAQHGGGKPATVLAGFKIGVVSGN